MKKYRANKILLILIPALLAGLYVLIFVETEAPINLMLIISLILVVGFIIASTALFVQFENDKVIIRQGDHAFINPPVKKNTLLFADIKSVGVGFADKSVVIYMKDGTDHLYLFDAYLKSKEILDNFIKVQQVVARLNKAE